MSASHDSARGVLVRIFPRWNIGVEVDRVAALHLACLLERYNWTLSDPGRRSDRWRKFWPTLTQSERDLVVVIVSNANDGQFGGFFDLHGFHLGTEVHRKLTPITGAVASEFVRLVSLAQQSATALH